MRRTSPNLAFRLVNPTRCSRCAPTEGASARTAAVAELRLFLFSFKMTSYGTTMLLHKEGIATMLGNGGDRCKRSQIKEGQVAEGHVL